ncbi:olfactory receptor 11H6-like isoform X2 [Paroedura picta]
MELTNGTRVQEFLLMSFGGGQQKRTLLLIFFTVLYVLTLAENFTIITVVFLDTHLSRQPMYILLSSFSWLELFYVNATVPRMLIDMTLPYGIISFSECFLQFYIFFSLGSTEFLFLSAMALDRYLAICHPLQYLQIMSPNSCYALAVTCWILGFLWHVVPITMISRLSFCGPNVIDHFMCDAGPIFALACPPLGMTPLVARIFSNALILGNIFFVVLSYSVVIFTLMKPSFEGSRRKAFSTISFHLIVVTIFYTTAAAMYLVPAQGNQSERTKVVTVFYTAGTPFVNPLIYSLRNNQVKEALQRVLRRKTTL